MNSLQQIIQNWIMTVLGLLNQEWKSEVTAHDRSGQPGKTSWSMIQQARPHHGETLLDGAAQSVRYGGILRDRSGQPDNFNFQEVADSVNFVMGSDAAEFVNKVNNQVRKRQKRISNVADSGEEHSIIWGMFMAATMNAATFMGKNFLDNQNSIMNTTYLILKKCSTYLQNWWANKMRSSMWIRFIGKNIHGDDCH